MPTPTLSRDNAWCYEWDVCRKDVDSGVPTPIAPTSVVRAWLSSSDGGEAIDADTIVVLARRQRELQRDARRLWWGLLEGEVLTAALEGVDEGATLYEVLEVDGVRAARALTVLGADTGGGGGGGTPGPTTDVDLTPPTLLLIPGATGLVTATPRDAVGTPTGDSVTYDSTNPTAATVNTSGLVTGVSEGAASITATAGGITSAPAVVTVVATSGADTAPAYTGAPGQTRYMNDGMSGYTNVDFMGAVARATDPGLFWVPRNCPLVDGTPTVPSTQYRIVTGETVGSKALQLRFPAGSASSWYLWNYPRVSSNLAYCIKLRLSQQVEFGAAFDQFSIKGVLLFNQIYPREQLGTHNRYPWEGRAIPGGSVFADRGSYQQVYTAAYTDELGRPDGGFSNFAAHAFPIGMDQATQPLDPYVPDLMDGIYRDYVYVFKGHTPAVGSVTVSGGVATFSTSQAGHLANGDVIRPSGIYPTGIMGGVAVGFEFPVSGFNGTNRCTLTGCPNVGPCSFAINGDGYSTLYIDGRRICDARRSSIGVIPPGGEKQWCGPDIVGALNVGDDIRGEVFLGESRTAGACTVLMNYAHTEIWTQPG